MLRKIAISFFGCIFWFTLTGSNLFADVYTWTDENGVKHYSNVAPAESAGEEVQKEKELSEDIGAGEESAAPPNGQAVSEESDERESEATAESAEAESAATTNKTPESADVDTTASEQEEIQPQQGNAVEAEKQRVQELAGAIADGSLSRENLIENERKRLEQVIQDLQNRPLDQFGSQKNKRRQVGYYQYRLQELLNSPDNYLRYGEGE